MTTQRKTQPAGARCRAPGSVKAHPAARPPADLRALAALAAGLGGAFLSVLPARAVAACTPSPTTVVSADTATTVAASCPDESITVNAVIDVPGGTGLTNDDGGTRLDLGSVTVTGTIRGQNPVDLAGAALSGGITNSGTIQSYWSGGGSGFGGPALTLNDLTIAGTIANSGTIDGDYTGVALSNTTAPLLVNSGSINSLAIGVEVNGGATLTEIRNEAAGTIHGNNNGGIVVRNGSTVQLLDNRGTLSSSAAGVSVFNGGTITRITNAQGATVTGQRAIEVEATVVDVDNAGRLEGTGAAISLYNGSITGTLTNLPTGVISGGSAGISLGTYDQPSDLHALINQGLIEGGDYGIDGHEGSVMSAGINNSGTIRGGRTGVLLVDSSSITGGLVNSGTIQGDEFAIRVTGGSSLDRLDLTGTQAALLGDVDAPDTDVNVKAGATFTTTNAFNVRAFAVESGGTLVLTGAGHTAGGLGTDGITVSHGFSNLGNVSVAAGTTGLVNGTYTQSVGGTLTIGVDSLVSHGVLSVSGDATLAPGTTVAVAVGGSASFSPGDRVQGVLTSGATLTVDAAGLSVQDNSVRYRFTADTGRLANELDLLVAEDEAPFLNNIGDRGRPLGGLAENLDKLLTEGVPPALQPVIDRLGSLPAEELPTALAQLLPVMTGAGAQAGVNALRAMNKIIQSRVESNQGLSAGDEAADRYLWVRAFGSTGEQDSQGDVAGFRSRTGGFVLGADRPVNERLRAGLAFTFARTDIGSRGSVAPSSLDVNTYELVHYGSYNLDPVTDVNYQIDAGYNDVKGERRILFIGQQADSDFSSINLHASLGIGRTWQVSPGSSVTPSIRADYTRIKTKSYTETGAGALNLRVDSSTFEELMFTADVKGSHALNAHTKLVGNVSVGYDVIDDDAVTTSAFVGGGTVFETRGLNASPWLYRTGLGVLHDRGGLEYSLRYDLERRTSGYTNQTVSARVRWAF